MKVLIEITKTDKASGLIKGVKKNIDAPLAKSLVDGKKAKYVQKKGEKK